MRKKNVKNFKLTKTNHLIVNCKVNTINGKFILDTGASNSCINYLYAEKFKINPTQSLEKASSVTSEINKTYFSKNNTLEFGGLIKNNFEVILFDMSHINNSFKEKEIHEVDGIIGGDILVEFNAIINYKKKEIILNL